MLNIVTRTVSILVANMPRRARFSSLPRQDVGRAYERVIKSVSSDEPEKYPASKRVVAGLNSGGNHHLQDFHPEEEQEFIMEDYQMKPTRPGTVLT